MPCNCPGLPPNMAIPDHTALAKLDVPQLRQLANAHNIGSDGISKSGQALWRSTANKGQLETALLAHTNPTTIHEEIESEVTPSLHGSSSIEDGIKNISTHIAKQVVKKLVPPMLEKLEEKVAKVDLSEIRAMVDEEITKVRGSFLDLKITVNDLEPIDLGRQHALFPKLLKIINSGVHVMLVGPAGSGKTEAAMAAAKALNLECEVISVGPQTTQSELAGYRDANGNYRDTALRRAYQHGRLLVVDELDAGNGGVFTFVNACLSNKLAGFPDGPIVRHPDFRVIGCANTFGTGADMQYVGRSQLDAATLDRFTVLVWDYDEGFELDLALAQNPDSRAWVDTIWKYRRNMLKSKVRHIISPRASINGAKLMKQGFQQTELEKMLIFKGLNKEAVTKIKGETP